MSILLIAAPHMDELIIVAAVQEPFNLDTKTLISKIHERSHNGYFQDNGHKWIKWNNSWHSSFIKSNRIETSHNSKEGVYLKTQNGRNSKTKIVCKYMIKNNKTFQNIKPNCNFTVKYQKKNK